MLIYKVQDNARRKDSTYHSAITSSANIVVVNTDRMFGMSPINAKDPIRMKYTLSHRMFIYYIYMYTVYSICTCLISYSFLFICMSTFTAQVHFNAIEASVRDTNKWCGLCCCPYCTSQTVHRQHWGAVSWRGHITSPKGKYVASFQFYVAKIAYAILQSNLCNRRWHLYHVIF